MSIRELLLIKYYVILDDLLYGKYINDESNNLWYELK